MRTLFETSLRALATALSEAPLTRTLVGALQNHETSALPFAQAHRELYDSATVAVRP